MVMRMSCIVKCSITWPKYQIFQLLVLLPLIYWLQASNSIETWKAMHREHRVHYYFMELVLWLCELSVVWPDCSSETTNARYRGHLKTLLLPRLYGTCNFDLLKYVAYMYHVYCGQFHMTRPCHRTYTM